VRRTIVSTPTPPAGLLRSAIEGLYKENGATMTEQDYRKEAANVANLLRKGGKPDPSSQDDQVAAAALRRVAVNGWLKQLREHGTGEGGVSPNEVQSLVDAGAINPDGSIKDGRAFVAMLKYADQHPEANINTFVNSWTSAVTNGEGVNGAKEITTELRGLGAQLPPNMAAAPTTPTGTAPAEQGTTPAPVPAGLDPASVPLRTGADGSRPVWVTPDDHVYGIEPDGTMTDMNVQTGAYARAQELNRGGTNQTTATQPQPPKRQPHSQPHSPPRSQRRSPPRPDWRTSGTSAPTTSRRTP